MRLGALLLLCFALAGCVAAPGRVIIDDETERLGRAAVEAAAEPLVARGVVVGIFLTERGDDTGADFQARLGAAGMLEGGRIAPQAIALYVSYEPRYSELRAGTRWSGDLPDAALREVREGELNPALRDQQATAGVAATLAALEGRLASPPLLGRVWGALSSLALAGLALWLLAVSPIGAWLGRTPPGRLARWLVDQTPWGRRRLERITRTTRARLADRAEYARSWCRGAAATPQGPGLMNRLKILDQERAGLDGRLRGRALEEAMDRLAWDYTSLGGEASRLAPPRAAPKGKRKRGATATGAAFTAGAAESYASDSSSSDSSSSWDSGSSYDSSGPSSDGGSW